MDDSQQPYCLVLTTADTAETAERIAAALVERRLAACVNVVGGVRSVYRWKGELSRDDELLLLIKTSGARFPAVRDAIRETHTYEVPEVLAIPIGDGDPTYLDWLGDCLKG